MSSFNKIIMLGNLTREPKFKYLANDTPVIEFALATNRKWINKDGSKRQDTCFIDCQGYGQMAVTINKYCRKGEPLLIEGRLEFSEWEKDGQKRSKHRITLESFSFVGLKHLPERDDDPSGDVRRVNPEVAEIPF